jgi:uncharacterized repeat protein (TIGR01451 family)
MPKKNVSNTMRSIYGTGNFNPRSFERKQRSGKSIYVWGITLFLFAIVAVILSGMFLFGSTPKSFTGERIDFKVEGEKSPKTAIDTSYTITITNNEEVAIENVELFIDWGSDDSGVKYVSSDIQANSEANNTWQLADIGVGESVSLSFVSRFTGNTDSKVNLAFELTFIPSGFSSNYTTKHSESFSLGDPTISLEITGPSVAGSDSEITLSLNVSGDSLENEDKESVILELRLAEDFKIVSTNPELADEKVVKWVLSELIENKGEYSVSIVVTVSADVGQKAGIEAHLYLPSNTIEPFLSSIKQIEIQNSSVKVSMESTPAQGKKLQWGERVDYEVTIQNTGTYVLRDVVVRVPVPNDALWQSSSLNINNGGFYESGNIFWDTTTTSALDSIRPDAKTKFSFSMLTSNKPPRGFAGIPRLVANTEISAKLGDQEVIVESSELITNILADVEFDVEARYTSAEGVLLGSGSHPPVGGEETTYAIIWTIGPTSSGLKDITFNAKLPNNVTWKNDTKFSVGEISYSDETGVEWKASRIPALALPIKIQFKVGISGPISSGAKLIEQGDFKMLDDAAGEELEFFSNALTIGSVQ